LTVCGEAGAADEALKAIVEVKPDLAIVDPSLGDSSGIDLITSAMAQSPSLMILVLSMRSESFHVERALRAGAKGYVTKDQGSQNVLAAIRRVLSGEVHLSRHLVSKMLARMTTDRSSARPQVIADLSNRELQVFELIGHGLSTREIAAKLHLSVKTIESHKEKIKKKLKLRDASRLYRHAVLWSEYHKASGIISPPGEEG
jgi:DNA-binding NarL/FixJ family response regulator